ncbi:MAG TPA: arylamine N-acetyltransferase [Pseudonocardiaceae bacterium]|nr:arylamine N-acetyltransferase [Pseudonocardiaceae bacterium]
MLDRHTVTAYLARIDARPGAAPSAGGLRELAVRHVTTVPFENLDIPLGVPITLSVDALVNKIVHQRRGGFCYELNGLFAELLRAIGYRVTLLAAQVYGPDGTLGPPFDHLALRVDLEQAWLVDVGFGQHARLPLLLDSPADQADPDGRYQVRPVPDGSGDVDVLREGEPVYRLERHPRSLRDFGAMCWFQQHSPESAFTRKTTVTLPRPDGRITLSGRRLIRTTGGERVETELSDTDRLAAYRDVFGIELDHLPPVPD